MSRDLLPDVCENLVDYADLLSVAQYSSGRVSVRKPEEYRCNRLILPLGAFLEAAAPALKDVHGSGSALPLLGDLLEAILRGPPDALPPRQQLCDRALIQQFELVLDLNLL